MVMRGNHYTYVVNAVNGDGAEACAELAGSRAGKAGPGSSAPRTDSSRPALPAHPLANYFGPIAESVLCAYYCS